MNTYKTKGIVIRRFEVGEADRILIVFTKKFGKIPLKAKGVRKTLAKLKGHLELFNLCDFIIARSRQSSIDVIIQAETKNNFAKLKKDIKKQSRIYLLFEFLDRILPEKEAHSDIFELLIYVLKNMQEQKSKKRRLLLIPYFYLQTLKRLGYRPHFRECIKCQIPLNRGGNYFDIEGGGVVGREHIMQSLSIGEQAKLIPVSDQAIVGLRLLIENGKRELRKIKADKDVIEEIYQLVEKYVTYIIDAELKSKKFVLEVD